MNGYESAPAQPAFVEDVYLYDLNKPASAPLAYRCARGGEKQPPLLELLGLGARQWLHDEQRLYDMPLCLCEAGGAVVLPVFGSIGRLVVVVKPTVSLHALAYLAQSARLGTLYVSEKFAELHPHVSEREREATERFAQTVARLRLLIDWCASAESVGAVEDCISLACELWGVELMPVKTAEFSTLQGQVLLSEMRFSGQVLAVTLMTMLSVMRYHAHARSGWLYAARCEAGIVLQAAFRMASECPMDETDHLRELFEDGGIAFGTRDYQASVKPPRQYAYLHRKITDPQHPYCARCGCLDKRCATCMAVQWAVMPYVCDAALLGIKNYFSWSE